MTCTIVSTNKVKHREQDIAVVFFSSLMGKMKYFKQMKDIVTNSMKYLKRSYPYFVLGLRNANLKKST